MAQFDKPRRNHFWYLALVLLIFGMYSLVMAATTAEDCDGLDKTWQVFPPKWECERPGVG